MRRKSSERVLSSRLTCLLFVAPARAQSFTGAIVGVVNDQSANPIANARVVAIEERTNIVTTALTDGEGIYSFPALRAGQYRLEIEAAGFRKLARTGVEVQVNARLRLEMATEVGQVSDSVNVSGGAPLVESESGALGNVIENRKITNLPLNTRNPFQLAVLSPGVVPGPNFGAEPELRQSEFRGRHRASEYSTPSATGIEDLFLTFSSLAFSCLKIRQTWKCGTGKCFESQ